MKWGSFQFGGVECAFLFILSTMRHLRFQTIFLSPIIFSNLATTLPNVIVARQQCESEWCLPLLPWDPLDAMIGAGAAAVGNLINGFVKPQAPIGTNEKDSDVRVWTNTNTEPNVNPQVEDDQCRTSDNLPGQVSFDLCREYSSNTRVSCLMTIHQGTSEY